MITNKKGLSDIVVTLIIIGIALAAVGIVWYVLNVVMEEQATEVKNMSGKVFQDCGDADYFDLAEAQACTNAIDGDGTVKYVGGHMCCTINPD